MKRTISLLLVLALCLSLCACRAETTSHETTEAPTETVQVTEIAQTESPAQETIYAPGDSIETDLFRITPSFTGYAYELANWPDENFMKPEGDFSGKSPYSASDGKTEMYGEIAVEYIGSEKSDVFLDLSVSADYDDGYIFETVHMGTCLTADGKWGYTGQMVFEPLSSANTRLVRYCIEVPEQVETNVDKPLVVTFFVNGEPYAFDFRCGNILGSDYDPRAEYYLPVENELKAEIVDILKATKLKEWGWYNQTFGIYTFTFDDTTVDATLPINSNYQYNFTGTYEVFSGTILITWDYGQQMHLDYTFDEGILQITAFRHDK